jgi:hypothetical protein
MSDAKLSLMSCNAEVDGRVMHLLEERYRCAEDLAVFRTGASAPSRPGFFRFGPETICYGRCSSGPVAGGAQEDLHDAAAHVAFCNSEVDLPFEPEEIVENLRRERYLPAMLARDRRLIRKLYYLTRPLLGIGVRKHLQRWYFRDWQDITFPRWPVEFAIEEILERLLALAMKARGLSSVPFIWFWPRGAATCTIMTHDVEETPGLSFCPKLMDIDDSFGVKSSFQIVPEERYSASRELLDEIKNRGFEVNVHDLNHDGRLIWDAEEFKRRADKINEYGRQFGAAGFRAAIMYRNLDWYENLEFSYDMSAPSTAHLEPQHGGCCTVLPFPLGNLIELPLTTTQDYSLFNILNEYSIDLWKRQIALIRGKHGLVSFIVHPDYLLDPKPRRVYVDLLEYIANMNARGETWLTTPGEVAAWWRQRRQMRLVKTETGWSIAGDGSDRATIAYAVLADGDQLHYEFGPPGQRLQTVSR